MDILIDVQESIGYLSDATIEEIAEGLEVSAVDVHQTVSFYHFFTTESRGTYTVYLSDSAIAVMKGREQVVQEFEREAGCAWNSTTEDGLIGLYDTADIGMADQEPAAIINGKMFPNLTTFRVRELVADMRAGKTLDEMRHAGLGDGNNARPEINAPVYNNLRKRGPVVFDDYEPGSALQCIKDQRLSPDEVIELVKQSGIRGRGGAGFPTGMKWQFARQSPGERRYVFCNADEGEPGTFKDRVILTERPRLVFDGMAAAAYAVGAEKGILYLRYEYRYLREFLEKQLEEMRAEGWLGENIGGKQGYNFEIRIQFGAGSYVCGEESALIESAEGKRGEPRDRPPFPVQEGYLNMPTAVNNVETLCLAAKVLLKGPQWYKQFGTAQSSGTKVLSISGDCQYPGIYEVEWGFTVYDVLEMVGARPEKTQAVQVGGPAGTCIGPNNFDAVLGYEDVATGGSIIIVGQEHDLLADVVRNFNRFFVDESCGACATCRVLTVMYGRQLEKVLSGNGKRKDIDAMVDWAKIAEASRCGLGKSAPNPIVNTIKNFRYLYEGRIRNADERFETTLDLTQATAEARKVTGRPMRAMSN